MARTPQEMTIARYEAVTITATMDPATNVTGWTFALNIRSAGSLLSGYPVTTFSITAAGDGVFTVSLTSTQTAAFAAGAVYNWDIWRTNSGAEKQLAFGTLNVAEQQWQT